MTKKEAVIANLQLPGYSDSAVEKALIDAGISGTDSYTTSDKAIIDSVTVQVLKGMKGLSSMSEGGMSLDFSKEGIDARLGELEGTVSGPTLSAVNLW